MAKVSVVIPTKNEYQNIRLRLLELLSLQTLNYDYEAVVVDDSDDATAKIAKGLGARVIKGQRKGLGQAIIDGIEESKGDIIVIMDSDGSHAVSAIPSLVHPLLFGGQDMVIGSRYVKNGGTIGWTTKRKIVSRVACAMAYPLTGLRDNTAGFFGFRSSILNGADLKPTSWKIMLEVLVKAKPAKVMEVPIQFKDRQLGKSKFTFKQTIAYLKHLFLLALYKYITSKSYINKKQLI